MPRLKSFLLVCVTAGLFVAAAALAPAPVAIAAPVVGTCTVVHATIGNIRRITISCTADAATGSIPNTTLPTFEGRLIQLETNPGATAPTDNYDITIEDAQAMDVLQGVGANRDTTNTEAVAILFTSSAVNPVVDESDVLTFKIANNVVNSALFVVILTYALGG